MSLAFQKIRFFRVIPLCQGQNKLSVLSGIWLTFSLNFSKSYVTKGNILLEISMLCHCGGHTEM